MPLFACGLAVYGFCDFDNSSIIKKLIEKITVFANHFTVDFKSGITIDIEA